MIPYTVQYYLRKLLNAMQTVDAMPQEARDEIANGCGSGGAIIDLVDDDPLGADFGPGCEAHDIRYRLGENDEDKAIADLLFLNMMVLSIIYNDSQKGLQALQLNVAMKYYAAVHFLGRKAFYADK